MRLLVDADPVVYGCAFVAEDATYFVILADGRQLFFDNGDAKKAWKKENKESDEPIEIIDEFQQVDVGPLSHSKAAARTQLNYIKTAVADHWKVSTKDLHVTLVLSGKTNFRNAIAVTREYKGNRKEVRKPEHHGAVRAYLKHDFDAVEVENREADDEIAILAHQCIADKVPYAVATIDKDLDQIPGLKFDYNKKVFYEVEKDEAMQLFWGQVLSGDSTDNIPGCPGVGAVKAKKLVDMWTEAGAAPEDIWAGIVEVYEQGKRHAKCEYEARSAEDAALETARLVHLQTYPGQLWNPPGIKDGRVEVGLDD